VTDANSLTATDGVTVTVVQPLTVDAGSNRTIITGGSTTLAGSATGGLEPFTYAWTPATGLSATLVAQPTAFPTATTTYTLTVTDAMSQAGTDTVTVTVNGPLTADAGADTTITLGGSVTLQGVASGGVPPYTYQWSPATGLNATNVANPVASPTKTINYSFSVTDSASNTATDAVVVTVTSEPSSPENGNNPPEQQTTTTPVFNLCGLGAVQASVLTGLLLMLMSGRRRR
jgi:hypothetical protein